ncbi:MAG: dephospho-CoA kinase [Actinobacteria bacterium]|nr:dephospho-CoA kinase [Actinomycetota bacterium]
MFYVALTGGIASGKSTVCRLLEEKGAHLLDSDLLAREVVRRGTPAWREIVDHFGREILTPEGEIDRAKLGKIVFSHPAEREFLNRVTHPRIFQLMGERLKELEEGTGGEGVVILDIPLLVEAGAGNLFHLNLVVDAPEEEQARRLVEDRGLSPEEAWARIRSQASREERLRCADLVITNDGSLEKLRRQVDRAWEEIKARSRAGDRKGRRGG